MKLYCELADRQNVLGEACFIQLFLKGTANLLLVSLTESILVLTLSYWILIEPRDSQIKGLVFHVFNH